MLKRNLNLFAFVCTPLLVCSPVVIAQDDVRQTDNRPLELSPSGPDQPDSISRSGSFTADDSDWIPVRFGDPLALRPNPNADAIRNLILYRGRASKDEAESKFSLYFYHSLPMTVLPAEAPILDLPVWVHGLKEVDGEFALVVKLRLSSQAIRRTCEEFILEKHQAYIAEQREKLGSPKLKIVVERVPATEVIFCIQERLNGTTLAYGRGIVRSAGDVVEWLIPISVEALALVRKYDPEDLIQFQAVVYYSGNHGSMAARRTAASFESTTEVERVFDSEERSGRKPIFQDKVDRFARNVQMATLERVSGDAEAIKLLNPASPFLQDLFTAEWMTQQQITESFPQYTDQMLASYLERQRIIEQRTRTDSETNADQRVNEKTSNVGGRIGVNIPVINVGIGFGGNKHNRNVHTVYKAKGIEISRGTTSEGQRSHRIRVYRLVEGWETRKSDDLSVFTVSRGKVTEGLIDTPFTPRLTDELLHQSLRATASQLETLERLRAKKQGLIKERQKILSGIEEKQASYRDRMTLAANQVADNHAEARGLSEKIVFKEYWTAVIKHIYAVWGWHPPQGVEGVVPYHWNAIDSPTGKSRNQLRHEQIVRRAELDEQISRLLEEVDDDNDNAKSALEGALTEIDRLNTKIAEVDARIEALLGE